MYFNFILNTVTEVPLSVNRTRDHCCRELDVIRKIETFHGMYMQIYPRVGPYLVGSALALLVRKLKENRYTFSQVSQQDFSTW